MILRDSPKMVYSISEKSQRKYTHNSTFFRTYCGTASVKFIASEKSENLKMTGKNLHPPCSLLSWWLSKCRKQNWDLVVRNLETGSSKFKMRGKSQLQSGSPSP